MNYRIVNPDNKYDVTYTCDARKVLNYIYDKTWEGKNAPNFDHGVSPEEIAENTHLSLDIVKEIIDVLVEDILVEEAESKDGTYVYIC